MARSAARGRYRQSRSTVSHPRRSTRGKVAGIPAAVTCHRHRPSTTPRLSVSVFLFQRAGAQTRERCSRRNRKNGFRNPCPPYLAGIPRRCAESARAVAKASQRRHAAGSRGAVTEYFAGDICQRSASALLHAWLALPLGGVYSRLSRMGDAAFIPLADTGNGMETAARLPGG